MRATSAIVDADEDEVAALSPVFRNARALKPIRQLRILERPTGRERPFLLRQEALKNTGESRVVPYLLRHGGGDLIERRKGSTLISVFSMEDGP